MAVRYFVLPCHWFLFPSLGDNVGADVRVLCLSARRLIPTCRFLTALSLDGEGRAITRPQREEGVFNIVLSGRRPASVPMRVLRRTASASEQ